MPLETIQHNFHKTTNNVSICNVTLSLEQEFHKSRLVCFCDGINIFELQTKEGFTKSNTIVGSSQSYYQFMIPIYERIGSLNSTSISLATINYCYSNYKIHSYRAY